MNPETLQALHESIAIWNNRVALGRIEEPVQFCPLCDVVGYTCKGCPVMKKTGEDRCHGSPFWSELRDTDYVQYARNELEFLQSLLEENHAV